MIFNDQVMGKVEMKSLYSGWSGESFSEIQNQQNNANPYTIRIGMPAVDQAMKTDKVYFILHYMSYNVATKQVEMRHIVPQRNMERIYIGQSLDEQQYADCRLLVDGTTVVDDLYLKAAPSLEQIPLTRLLVQLVDRVEKLQQEVIELKRSTKQQHTYLAQDESPVRSPS